MALPLAFHFDVHVRRLDLDTLTHASHVPVKRGCYVAPSRDFKNYIYWRTSSAMQPPHTTQAAELMRWLGLIWFDSALQPSGSEFIYYDDSASCLKVFIK